MGVYAPSRYNKIDAILKGGYTPPLSYGYNTTLSSSGLYIYLPSRYNSINAVLKASYTPPASNNYFTTLNLVLDNVAPPEAQYIFEAGGVLSSVVSTNSLVQNKRQYLLPVGLLSQVFSEPKISQRQFVSLSYDKNRLSTNIVLKLDSSYNPNLNYRNVSLYERGITTFFSKPNVRSRNETVSEASLYDQLNIGVPAIRLNSQIALVKAIDSQRFGQIGIINKNQRITTIGYDQLVTGIADVFNSTQYRYLSGFDSSQYGIAYLIGGVKYLELSGISSNVFGSLVLTNTTADQEVTPSGISKLDMPAPTVSPRILYAAGINSLSDGLPEVRDPSVKPLGDEYSAYGTPTVWFHTRPLVPVGMYSYESGYLRIADPTQFVQAPSLIESAIFGDTAIRNLSFKVSVKAINESSFSDYATLTNSNRYYAPKGISSLSIGAATIYNKTPSIFVSSIAPYDAGTPAIGHAIRFVQPSGFDRLLFGLPVMIKAPELLVVGHKNSVVSSPTVWYKNRTINLDTRGIDSFKAGNKTVWFGLRPINPSGWVSSSYSVPQLTHGVRTVEPQGFRRDELGVSWVGQGTRALEPEGIYKDFPSNHMVGGTQTVKPVGYEATLWGERIIPISQSVQPIGFREAWGNATADLFTKYITPVGYISVGQQPADRWGDVVFYNKLQHIVQNFDINSGLVPPKWPDYMLIENRNKTIGVTSFVATKFGYSQIDNNAAPLLPLGIEPPPITISMISHGIRSIAPEAIDPVLMSDWGVVHNAARVIAPTGLVHTSVGQPVVANTRRYYSGVGRFESLETGTPMIAYRIRTIDIEPRYSIAPPQINLPTIGLYTRYVGFNGYETTRYGTASLSIHFNIISPSWAHREKFGESVVRNVTPELQVGAFDSQEFGRASIRTQWRHVQAQGDTATLFGLTKIADRRQFIVPTSWQDSRANQSLTVTKTGAPPYTPQNIWLQNESKPTENGYGIEPSSAPSEPGLNQNVLYHKGHDSQKFGDNIVSSNNLYIDIGISTKNITSGPTVINKNRYIGVEGIDNKILVSENAQVTPFYIKPLGFNYEGDGITFSRSKLGSPVVTNQHRAIYPQGHASSIVYFQSSIALQTRYIEPPTIRGFAMGFPEIPFTLKTIDAKDYGFDSEVHGNTTIAYPPYIGPQTVLAEAIDGFSSGNSRVELLHREVQASGSSSLRMGASVDKDTPYMWQGLRIGEFIPMSIGAGDTSLFGKTTIGLRVREIPVEGFVAFRSEYEPIKFKDRMKVTGSITDETTAQGITAGGISSQSMGSVGIKLGQHFIRPDGNSDQFRKGAF
jgi:hypothetical protein